MPEFETMTCENRSAKVGHLYPLSLHVLKVNEAQITYINNYKVNFEGYFGKFWGPVSSI